MATKTAVAFVQALASLQSQDGSQPASRATPPLAEMPPTIAIDWVTPGIGLTAEPVTTAAASVVAALGPPSIPGLLEFLSHRISTVSESAARTLERRQ